MKYFVIRCLIVAMTVAVPIALWSPPADACSSCPSSCPTPCQNFPGVDTIPGIGNTFLDRFFNPGGGSDPYGFGPGENPIGFGPARPPEAPFVGTSTSRAEFTLQQDFEAAAVDSGFTQPINLVRDQITHKLFVYDTRTQKILGGPFDNAEDARAAQRDAIEEDQAGPPPGSPTTTSAGGTAETTGTADTGGTGTSPSRRPVGYGRLGLVGAVLFGPPGALDPLVTSVLLSGEGRDSVLDELGPQQPFWSTGGGASTGTDTVDEAIDQAGGDADSSATQNIQDTPSGPPPPAGLTPVIETIRLPDGSQIQVQVGFQLDGKNIKAHHGEFGVVDGVRANLLETADGAKYVVGVDGHNHGEVRESSGSTELLPIYKAKSGTFIPRPTTTPTPGAQDDQASLPVFNDGFESGNTEAWVASDRRVKTDIERIGHLPSGLPVYRYRYIWSPTVHIGVMAQEAIRLYPDAVRTIEGFLAVDYSRIR